MASSLTRARGVKVGLHEHLFQRGILGAGPSRGRGTTLTQEKGLMFQEKRTDMAMWKRPVYSLHRPGGKAVKSRDSSTKSTRGLCPSPTCTQILLMPDDRRRLGGKSGVKLSVGPMRQDQVGGRGAPSIPCSLGPANRSLAQACPRLNNGTDGPLSISGGNADKGLSTTVPGTHPQELMLFKAATRLYVVPWQETCWQNMSQKGHQLPSSWQSWNSRQEAAPVHGPGRAGRSKSSK